MSMIQRPDSAAFAGLLKSDFVANSVPEISSIDPELELIKCKAGLLALTMFDPDKKEVRFGSDATFGSIFSQDIYGPGFTKGFSIISAYLICLEEEGLEGRPESVNKFAEKVRETTQKIFDRLSSGDRKLSDVRKMAEQFDNYGGYYQTTTMANEGVQKLMPEGFFRCPLEIDPYAGHLIAKIAPDLSQQLLDIYRPEIETYLTEEGKKNLKLPYITGCVVVAYKDELPTIPKEKVDSILLSNAHVDLSFNTPYIVPVRGDNRYGLVASIVVSAPDITKTRAEMGLKELYSAGRPLRYTFGAVHNPHIECDNESLVERMRKCKSLEPWMNFIDKQVGIKV